MRIGALVFDAYGTLYDTQSVQDVAEQLFPGKGEALTQIWRLKQLEYSWLLTCMERYEDFWELTRRSLDYAVETLGLRAEADTLERLMERYLHLAPYAETREALQALAAWPLAILSNGSRAMLEGLVRNSRLADRFQAVISVDEARAFKPSRRAYALVERHLKTPKEEILFVTSNAFDAAGAKHFGFKVGWVRRGAGAGAPAGAFSPTVLFRHLRGGADRLGYEADARLGSLLEVAGLVA
jgi:2-haloacid dehalogenase